MKNFKYAFLAVFIALAVIARGSPNSGSFQVRLVLEKPADDAEQMTLVSKWHSYGGDEYEKKEVLWVQKTALIDQNDIKSAEVSPGSPSYAPRIRIVFTKSGSDHVAQVTRDNVGKRLAFVIDGKLCSAPKIATAISSGVAEIAGSFNLQEAQDLVAKINESLSGSASH